MAKVFLVESSKIYKDAFIQMIQDYEKNGEREYFYMYKEALEDFDKYVEKLINNSMGIGLPLGWVSCCTYWLVNCDSVILGVIRIRKELNSEFLKNIGGHIGYDISPSHRRKEYGKLILKLGLEKVKTMNIDSVLLTCRTDNYASMKVIEQNQGVFDSEILDNESNKVFRRYWINVLNA